MKATFITLLFLLSVFPYLVEAGLSISPSRTAVNDREFTIVCDDAVSLFLDSDLQVAGLIIGVSKESGKSESEQAEDLGLEDLPENCRWVEITGMSAGEVNVFLGGYTTLEQLETAASKENTDNVSSESLTEGLGKGLVAEPCGGADNPADCIALIDTNGDGRMDNEVAGYGTCELVKTANNVVQFFITVLLPIFAVIAFIYAGFLMVTANGNVSQLTQARGIFTSVGLGLLIALAAWLIVNTVIAGLVGETSPLTRWNQIECTYVKPVNTEKFDPSDVFLTGSGFDDDLVGGEGDDWLGGGYGGGYYGGGGECEVLTSGPCSPQNLEPYFSSRAVEASEICNKESGGTPVMSGSDLCCGPGGDCSGAPSFSGGYFQLNILANDSLVPGCNMDAIFSKNCIPGQDCRTEGSCVRRNGSGTCTGWSCTINTSSSMYTTCMKGAIDSQTNLFAASQIFRSSGNSFRPGWTNSANICKIP